MGDNFNTDLSVFLKNNDQQNANRLVLDELAKALVKDKENFIEVLRSSDLSVLDDATDLHLIDTFVKNATTNKKLLLGASFLINHRNQTLNFDGEEEISDTGVKDTYKVIDEYFNAVGGVWAEAIKGVAQVGGGITNKVMDRNKGASNQLAQQSSARKELIQSVMAQRQAEQEQKLKDKAKTKRTIIIGVSITVAILIGVGVYFVVKKRNK